MPHIEEMKRIIAKSNEEFERQKQKTKEEEHASVDFDARRISEQD